MKLKQLINKIFSRFEQYIYREKLHLWNTLYFNFRTLPFSHARKFPIYIYGKVKFYSLAGNVVINSQDIKPGMIKLGRNTDLFGGSKGSSMILLSKKCQIVFDGFCSISTDFALRINGGRLQFGNLSRLGSSVLISCYTDVRIGVNTDVTYGCQIMDSNFHYIHYLDDQLTRRHSEQVIIGESNWIGNHSTIMKGTKTNTNTMVSTSSLLNKDYTKIYPEENILLAGAPAKKITGNCKRIFSYKKENEIMNFFRTNTTAENYPIERNYTDDPKDMISFF